MRTQDEAKGSSDRRSPRGIGDQQEPQDERRAVQQRTFTRWMNVFLQRRQPPLQVHDLMEDVRDGRILMALLEELTGCSLLYRYRSSSHRIFRLNNISKALAFLDDRHVKLLGIDASGVADGVSSVVLNLVWIIILHFQVKEVTRGLSRHSSWSLSSLSGSSCPSSTDRSSRTNHIGAYSCSTLPSKGRSAARLPKYQGKATKTLLQWVQRCTSKFGVEVHDFGKSWRSGLAFLALIKSIGPDLVDLRESLCREARENLQQAFAVAQRNFDITPLLEPEDVMCASPDEQSIITYVSMFLAHCSGKDQHLAMDMGVPGIPQYGSLECVSFGETPADDAGARALLRGLGRSSEQLLWKRWSTVSSGGGRASSSSSSSLQSKTSHLSSSDGDIASSCRREGSDAPYRKRGRGVFQPPSPLDAGVVNPDIRTWMENGLDQVLGRPEEGHLSLSSEEGAYGLSALDSDEEDAYSYILDLNKEVFQPKRRVPPVEEETVEEMNRESKQPEGGDGLNGHRSVEEPGEFHLVQNGGKDGEMTKSGFVIEVEPEDGSYRDEGVEEEEEEEEEEGEEVAAGEQVNDGGEGEKETEDGRLMTHDQTEVLRMTVWQKDAGADTDGHIWTETRVGNEGEESSTSADKELVTDQRSEMLEEEADQQIIESFRIKENGPSSEAVDKVECGSEGGILSAKEAKDTNNKVEDLNQNGYDENMDSEKFTREAQAESRLKLRRKELIHMTTSITQHLGETNLHSNTDGDANVHAGESRRTPACSALSSSSNSSGSSSEGGFIRQAFGGITPLEVETLVVLWLLLYCFFILPQMNLGGLLP